MKVNETRIKGLLVISPQVFPDDRGYFLEFYHAGKFQELGLPVAFLQDNESMSKKGVLRGMHFQEPPYAQGKLIRVVRGKIQDVAVDLRKHSTTYGQWESVILSGENKLMFWIPEGFAHGFVSLEEDTIVNYKCSQVYHPESEKTMAWNDPDLKISWDIKDPIISGRDRKAITFRDFNSPF
ncbi:MAG: dTDP-4-dehydrorhamnose 3,5-epimerase [Bacteroidetes bacterium]|nr:dTDP-4-dehydrorhamnose 3,5-epimerase [Bacteroidota bacterium]